MISQIGLPQLAGTAAGTVVSVTPVNAELLALYIANNSAGTVTLATTSPAPVTIMTMDAAGTQWFYPRVPTSTAGTAAGTIALAGVYAELPLSGYVQLSANAGGTVNVTLIVEQ
jgi:hypothetical protein